jgi:soluble lytic murein transglycosylase
LRRLSILIILAFPIFGSLALSADIKEKIKEYITAQKYQEAFGELQEAEKSGSLVAAQSPEIFWLKGYLEYELGRNAEAKVDFTEALKAEAWRSESLYYLALLEGADNNYKKVLDFLNQAEKNKANPSLKLKINFERARTLVLAKKWREASVQLKKNEKVLKGDSKYPDILKLMARVNLELNNYHGACKIVEKLYTKYPADPMFSGNLPFIEKAEVAGAFISCPVDDELFSNHRRALFGLGHADLANKEIDAWIEKHRLVGYEKDLLIVNRTVNEGNFIQALDVLLNYYEEKKNQVSYLALLASIAGRAGNFSLSIGANYRIYQLSPGASQKRKVLLQAAIFSFQIQDYDGAQSKFEKYIKSFPRSKNTLDAKWYIAWIQYLKGHYKESSELMTALWKDNRRQMKASSYREKIQYWLAMSLFKIGESAKTKVLLTNIIKNSPDISFYSLVAQQRLSKLNELGKGLASSINDENSSMQRVAFKMLFANAQSFPESHISYENAESTDEEVSGEDRSIASSVDEGEILDTESDDQTENEKTAMAETEFPDNLNSVQSAELQAKIDKARVLMAWGFEELGRSEYNDIERYIVKSEKNKSILEDYQKLKDYFRLSTLSYNVWSRKGAPPLDSSNRFIWENMYPLAYRDEIKKWTDDFNLPQALVWGIMKAESQYRPWVVSPVGAQGLMQIMPFTGKKVSELLGENQFSVYSLKDPAVAIKIGSKYLERMANNFHSSIPLIAAAYNAGPHRVQNWIYNFGYLEMDEWIEHIPYNETRLYVKRVTSNYFAYLNLYGDSIKSKKISLVDLVPIQINESMPLVERWD